MKIKSILVTLLLMVAGLQTTWAQKVVLNFLNKQVIEYNVSELENITFVEEEINDNHEWVDLGLPSGTLWATCNVGASSPEEYGDYFAWGETSTKSVYNLDTYAYYNDDTGYLNIGSDIAGTSYDAATANWGAPWCMPNLTQIKELIKNCSRQWTQQNGVNGILVTGPNGGQIFLPAAGHRWNDGLYDGNGLYWSSSPSVRNYDAYSMYFSSWEWNCAEGGYNRGCGFPVRAVRVQDTPEPTLVTGIILSETSISLTTGATRTLTATVQPENATNKNVTWSSSNDSIANVDQEGKVTAIAEGSCTVICSATDGSGVKAECQVTVTKAVTPDEHEYVDLGLPSGTLWATCNVGASSPEEYGDYFAWGETEPKEEYNWSTYKWCNGSSYTLTKYCTNSQNGYNGFTDGLNILLPEDDAATANWGSGWQIPSLDQIKELINSSYTTTTWTTENGVYGCKITSKSNGNSIFLPAAGHRWNDDLDRAGLVGFYRSSSLKLDDDRFVYSLNFNYNFWGWDSNFGRGDGFSVRPVHVQNTPILVTGITLSETKLSLKENETWTLTATVLPENADNKEVTWESSKPTVATIDQTGKVTAVAAGSCTITCSATDGSGVKAECIVTVKDIQLVTGITLNKTSLSLSLPTNTTYTLTATVQPTNATNKSIVWSSSNTSIATVDQTGKVTAKAAGSCTIIATAADESGVKAECSVTVVQLVTSITLSKTSLTLSKGMTETLTAVVQPSNANNKKVTWSSSNTSVATVDQTGKVTAKAAGSCTIIATAADESGVKAECSVTVVQLVTSITLSKTSLSLSLPTNVTYTLTATIQPTNATNKSIVWSSSNTSVATVDQTGKVTAKAAGSCTIIATAADGSSVKGECSVTVVQLVTNITLNETSLSLKENETMTLTATVLPENADNKNVTWTSNDESIATVDQTGKVTAKAAGSCTIIATAADGSGVKGECSVTVVQLVTNITLNETSLSLKENETMTLTATVLPENADNKNVTWTSNDESIAIVDQTGKVTAIAEGSCTITCSATDDSGVKAECQVTVTKAGDTGLLTCPDDNHPHAIDLGLPSGTKWACCNVGAIAPEGYGGYYAWGEVWEKSVYHWDTYTYKKSDAYEFTDIGSDIAYTTYDVATRNMGAPWCMPSRDQQQELISNCSRQWTRQNGVNGILVTGKNGGQIFLPAAGYRNYPSLYDAGSGGKYWSSSSISGNSAHSGVYRLSFSSSGWFCNTLYYRYEGLSVRAVCP